jgi:hypothetical protein
VPSLALRELRSWFQCKPLPALNRARSSRSASKRTKVVRQLPQLGTRANPRAREPGIHPDRSGFREIFVSEIPLRH